MQSKYKRNSGSNARWQLPRRVVKREPYILEQCRGKRVLDVGCIASYGYEEQIRNNTWLHAKIRVVASEALGVDNAKSAVEKLRNQYDANDIYYGDACHLEDLGIGSFDLIVASELLEHMSCPGALLQSAHTVLKPNGHILITTPNAFCARRFLGTLIGRESVHRDHVAYYSHRTLARLGEIYNYRIAEQLSYRLAKKRPVLSYLVEKVACAIAPNTAEGVICLFEKQ